ncbi:MAG TPA: Holliday junction resolvase RuvX [Planctomycetaceae bacterium]|nr:Holliday junction resolvase RuvX [Planctomycetaceae bacterium]
MNPTSEIPPDFPTTGRLAGVDFGDVRIGLAVTDPERILASPLANYTRRSLEADAEFFRQVAREERIVGWVVGLPLYASGEESPKAEEARRFGAWLAERTELPVAFFDERFTSREATRVLGMAGATRKKKKKHTDSIAAQILLRDFLEAQPGSRP